MFLRALVALVLAALGAFAVASGPSETFAARACSAVDGDTIRCGSERIRISNIDTPELGSHARCAAEAELAERAKRFTADRLAAGPVEIARDTARPRDRYGRTLATVRVQGSDLGEALVAAGLARRWDGRRHPWC
ncbi:MAG: thermonuclease family protein [Rhodospirillales bacterium]|nr:thermonuclease family protein [Rhodospirillales bacterium]